MGTGLTQRVGYTRLFERLHLLVSRTIDEWRSFTLAVVETGDLV
jgi:hypothetical protein